MRIQVGNKHFDVRYIKSAPPDEDEILPFPVPVIVKGVRLWLKTNATFTIEVLIREKLPAIMRAIRLYFPIHYVSTSCVDLTYNISSSSKPAAV